MMEERLSLIEAIKRKIGESPGEKPISTQINELKGDGYQVGTSTYYRYAGYFNKNGTLPNRLIGRPPTLNAASRIKVKEHIQNLDSQGKSICSKPRENESKLKDVYDTVFVEQVKAAGFSSEGIEPIKPRTFQRYCKQDQIVTVKSSATSAARRIAEADPRNFISLYRACKAVEEINGIVQPDLQLNMDATTFLFGGSPDSVPTKTLSNSSSYMDSAPIRVDINNNTDSGMALVVKLLAAVNAKGQSAAPMFVFDVAHNYDPIRIDGLHPESSQFGYIWLREGRSLDETAFATYFDLCLKPFMEDVNRTHNDIYRDDGHGILTFDGESAQVNALTSTTSLATYTKLNMSAIKLSANTTGIQQALDAGKVFSQFKNRVKTIALPTQEQERHSPIVIQLNQAIDNQNISITSAKKKKLITLCTLVQECLNSAFTTRNIASAFRKTGTFQLDLNNMIRQWRGGNNEIMQDTITLTCNPKQDIIDIFKARGAVTEQELDNLGVPRPTEEACHDLTTTNSTKRCRVIWMNQAKQLERKTNLVKQKEEDEARKAEKKLKADQKAAYAKLLAKQQTTKGKNGKRKATISEDNCKECNIHYNDFVGCLAGLTWTMCDNCSGWFCIYCDKARKKHAKECQKPSKRSKNK